MIDVDLDGGMSLLDLFKVAIGINRKRRITFVIVSLIGLILVYVLVGVVYNYSKTYYTSYFDYQLPALLEKVNPETGEITGYTYLDGTPFNYNSLVSYSNLKTAKESNEIFNDLDIDRMFEESDITASYSDSAYPYSISVKMKYFDSQADAKQFVSELTKLPVKISKDLVESTNNMAYLNEYKSATSYDEKCNDLIAQADYIIETYETLIEESPDVYVLYEGKLVKFSELMNISKARIEKLNLSLLLSEVESNHYVMNYDQNKEKLEQTLNNLKAESSKYQAIIDSYNTSLLNKDATSEIYENYAKYVDLKAQVDYKVTVYDGYVNNHAANTQSFDQDLSYAYVSLINITNILNKGMKSVYSDSSSTVYFSTNKVVEKTGDINIVIVIAASIVVGLLIGGITNVCLDVTKYKKKLEEERYLRLQELKSLNETKTN